MVEVIDEEDDNKVRGWQAADRSHLHLAEEARAGGGWDGGGVPSKCQTVHGEDDIHVCGTPHKAVRCGMNDGCFFKEGRHSGKLIHTFLSVHT
eukprot:349637-Chlamydomonas_euryale.AAC.3